MTEWLGGGDLRSLGSMRRLRCAACGASAGRVYGHTGYLRAGPATWWRMPAHILRLLRMQRSFQPNPIVYLIVTAAGAIVGVALDLAAGVPWWLVAVGVPVAFALATLVAPLLRSGSRGRLVDEVRRIRDPAGALARDLAREEERWRGADLPLLGLPSGWEGLRSAGGFGTQGEEVTRVEMNHFVDGTVRGPCLHVEVLRPDRIPAGADTTDLESRWELISWLATATQPSETQPDDPGEMFARWHEEAGRLEAELEARPWESLDVPVRGDPVDFASLRLGERWVAHARHGEHLIRLRSDRFPLDDVALVDVDLDPYLAGRRRIIEDR